MSHAATKWAFDQPKVFPDMKPNEQVVLFHLADCHNPSQGCYPSQDYICAKTNLSERAVRDQLDRLRDRGLVSWELARDNGRRGTNRYRLACEPDFLPANLAGSSESEPHPETADRAGSTYDMGQLPANSAGSPRLDATPANSAAHTGKIRQSNRQILPLHKEEPVIEPVIEPLREAHASEQTGELPSTGAEDAKAIERAFWRVVKNWPGFEGMPKEASRPLFEALTPDERAEAERKFPGWLALLRSQHKSRTPAPSTYFREKLWTAVPEPAAVAKATNVLAPAFGVAWNAARIASLLAGPTGPEPQLSRVERMLVDRGDWSAEALLADKRTRSGWPDVNAMHDRAEGRAGSHVAARFAELSSVMEPVPVGSPMFKAWAAHHAAQGWPWIPDPRWQKVVWFPKDGPDGLEAFEAAVTAGSDGAA